MPEPNDVYEALAEAGFTKAYADYHGSGDEGWIEEIRVEPELPSHLSLDNGLFHLVREGAYELLERHYGGWEINEGSEGQVTFDVEKRHTSIHHGNRIEQIEWETKEV